MKNPIDFIQSLRFDDLPDDVLFIMKRSLLDTIGVAVLGSTTGMSSIARNHAVGHMSAGPSGPKARMILDGRTVSSTGAAMAGAFTIDAIDAHDGYSGVKGHAGSGVFPAVLAVIDDLHDRGHDISGRDLILAMAIAYEISYRSALTMHASVPDYHTSGAWTAVGAAAAVGRLLGLSDAQLRHALGIAEYHAPRSQMMRCIEFPTNLRDGVGWGSPSGVSAAYMAELGFTGAPAITVEGVGADVVKFWSDLGTRWEINETHYKPYPVCRWAHPAIDAAAALMKDNNLSSKDVERVRIQTFQYAAALGGQEPKNLDELTYGLGFPVAIMIARGKIGAEEVNEATLTDPEILRINRAMDIVATDHYTKISTRQRWADVTLYLKDGRELMSQPTTPKGDSDNPLSDAEISRKFHLLAGPVIGAPRAEAIERLAANVDDPDFDLKSFLNLVFEPA